MDKRYLPAIASIFILALTLSSILPVYAVTLTAAARPTLDVVTIAEDDAVRNTGIILMGLTTPHYSDDIWGQVGWPQEDMVTYAKLLSQYKILVSYNGVPVAASITCQVIEKDKANPKTPQFAAENLMTEVSDYSSHFACKARWGKVGVGVLDVYYIGPATGQYIADYVLAVTATYTIGTSMIYGTELQDVCVLGWPSLLSTFVTGGAPAAYPETAFGAYPLTKPDGTVHWIYVDPLGLENSCEDMVILERFAMGLAIPIATSS